MPRYVSAKMGTVALHKQLPMPIPCPHKITRARSMSAEDYPVPVPCPLKITPCMLLACVHGRCLHASMSMADFVVARTAGGGSVDVVSNQDQNKTVNGHGPNQDQNKTDVLPWTNAFFVRRSFRWGIKFGGICQVGC